MTVIHLHRALTALLAAGLSAVTPSVPVAQTTLPTATRLSDGVVLWKSARTSSHGPAFVTFFTDFAKTLLPSPTDLPFHRSVAFLVGVSEYTYLRPSLPFVRNDLFDLKSYLLERGGFDAVYIAADAVVTQSLIENYMMNRFPAELGPRDRLLFYYSGHGADAHGTTGYLQFASARPGDFSQGVLPVSRVTEWAKVNPAAHMLFVLDSCSSGLAFTPRSGGAAEDQQRLVQTLSGRGSRTVVTAGTAGEQTFEVPGAGHGNGVFTRALLGALDRGRSQPTGSAFLTIEQVFGDLQVSVAKFAAEARKSLHPQRWKFDDEQYSGTFVFLNPAVLTASRAAPPPQRLGAPRGSGSEPTERAESEGKIAGASPSSAGPPVGTGESARVVHSLGLREGAPEVFVDLVANAPLVWTSFHNAEGKVVVELPNAVAGPAVADLLPDQGLVSAVKVRRENEESRPMVRLIIETRHDARYSVTAEGTSLQVRLQALDDQATKSASASKLSLEPVPERVATPRLRPGAPPGSGSEPGKRAGAQRNVGEAAPSYPAPSDGSATAEPIRRLLARISGRPVPARPPWLGITYREMEISDRSQFNLSKGETGIVITSVSPQSPLFDVDDPMRRDLFPEPIFLSQVNGHAVTGIAGFEALVGSAKSKDHLRFDFLRPFHFFVVIQVP